MATPKPPPKPAPLTIGDVKATPIRGPKDGRWYWRARRHRGGERTLWTGWATREEAQTEIARIVGGAPRTAADVSTVGDVLDFWIGSQELRQDLAPRSLETMTATVRALVREIGDVRANLVTLTTLERYRDARMRPGLTIVPRRQEQRGRLPSRSGAASETVSRELRTLGTAWAWAHERGLVASATLPRIRIRRTQPLPRYTPTPHEVAAVLAHLGGGRAWAWPDLVTRIGFATGARLGEIASLRFCDFDATTNTIHVDGKTGRRPVPVEPRVMADVMSRLPAPPIPPDPESRIWPVTHASLLTSMPRLFTAACAAAECQRWTAHALRRLAVDLLFGAGVDPGTESAIMGHSAEVAIRHYRRAKLDVRRAGVRLAGLGVLPRPAADEEKVLDFPGKR